MKIFGQKNNQLILDLQFEHINHILTNNTCACIVHFWLYISHVLYIAKII